MVEPDGVDGRHKAGHDAGGSLSTVIAIRADFFLSNFLLTKSEMCAMCCY
jgi:hypothetical protein